VANTCHAASKEGKTKVNISVNVDVDPIHYRILRSSKCDYLSWYGHTLNRPTMKYILIITMLSVLSLAVWLAIRPTIEITFEELSVPNTNVALNLTVDQESTSMSDLISTGDPTYDQFDSYIINASNYYGIADKLMVKSLIMQESHFDTFIISSDSPCGVPDDWTDQESKSFGLTQVTPACGEVDGTRPNLTTDKNSPNWPTSLFNPEFNINQGVKELSDSLLLMKSKFSGCNNEQYMLMALGAYNSGEDAIEGCDSWNDRADNYITNVTERYRTLSQMVNNLHPN
jgi:soluble lytic murein transglycosylase-like protein